MIYVCMNWSSISYGNTLPIYTLYYTRLPYMSNWLYVHWYVFAAVSLNNFVFCDPLNLNKLLNEIEILI